MVPVERTQATGTWICCVPCYWVKRSKSVHKALLTFAMLLVTSLLVTSPVLFLITTLPDADQPRNCAPLDEACIRERDGQDEICVTKACNEGSRKMLASMNRDVDPCNDFYQFACGSFRDRESSPSSSSFTILQKQIDRKIQTLLANETGQMVGVFEKIGLFYSSCVAQADKEVNFTPVYTLLEESGGYIPPKSSASTDITFLVATLLKINGAPLFDFYVDVDLYDHTRVSVFLDLPSRHLADTFFSNKYKDGPRWHAEASMKRVIRKKRSNPAESQAYTVIKNARDEYRCHTIEKILHQYLPMNMEKRERSYETYLLLQFCLSLSKIYPRQKDLYNWVDVDQRVYVPYNLTYLQDNFNYIRWKTLLNITMDNDTLNNLYKHGTTDDQFVYVYITAPRYFRSLGKLLNQFSKRVVHNGLLLLYAVDTLHDIVNVTASNNWNVSCSKLTRNLFSEMVGALYVQQYKPQYLQLLAGRVNNLFERVKETLAERILVKSWLDDDTRAQSLLKLTELRGKFHVWPGFHNKSLLAHEMAKVVIEPDFFTTVIKRFRQLRNLKDQVLRGTLNDRWRNPYAVNAYYESSTNSIVIPLAMMTAWSWSWEGGPAYSAHATLGSVIAHEILHVFDLHHRLPLDPEINLKNWVWITPKSWSQLESKIECVARLYAKRFWRKVQFYGNEVDVQFDWNVTRNENVADIGALQISYQTWYTLTNGRDRALPILDALRPSQMFFISAAQTYCTNMTAEAYILSVELDYHTPSPERVNVVMMNSPGFAEAFRCPLGSRMNPPNKCSTW
ncbi:endothelin-converting enzyme 1-like isoform X1 [Cotesia glomerata]|uniref:endothelin-converting enzyme 1-like isoform X1 n=2 Tax=Cotesia glomerata TaxID=32391 RepID=UPI001D01C0C6|nr:endothelin-converting enzyme 1-like isoform X1 [Cotesia glomerata]XP_044585980.1 endothelin-converting enzyme 1-like isoform X1 [Cotesia glomerata]